MISLDPQDGIHHNRKRPMVYDVLTKRNMVKAVDEVCWLKYEELNMPKTDVD